MTTDDKMPQTSGAAGTGAADPAIGGSSAQRKFALERCLFFGHVLEALAQGSVFRSYLSSILKVVAAGIAFTGVIAIFNVWQFTSRQEASGIIGGLAYMFFLLAGIYMVVHAFIIRAGKIRSLPDGPLTLVPVCAILALLAGEAFAAFTASVSLGGGVLIWFAQRGASRLLQDVSAFVPLGDGADFLAGILFMIRGLVRAVVVLLAAYLVSELLLIFAKIAGWEVRLEKD